MRLRNLLILSPSVSVSIVRYVVDLIQAEGQGRETPSWNERAFA
jgi:hypothetical protein